MSAPSSSSGGIGFGGALFLVFLVLKLTGVIAWSWWWVTAPLWIPVALVFVAILAIEGRRERKLRERRDALRRSHR